MCWLANYGYQQKTYMNANLTLNGLTFTQNYNSETGSRRTEVSRGPNLPEILEIKHTGTLTELKRAAIKTTVSLKAYEVMSDGKIDVLPMYFTCVRPLDVNITSAKVTDRAARLVNLIHGATNTDGLGLAANIFVTNEQ